MNGEQDIDIRFAQYIERRLHEWGEWFDNGNCYGLGYGSCSVEYRMMTEGFIDKNHSQKPLTSNRDAEEIEFMIRQMYKQDKKIAIALCKAYLRKSNFQDSSYNIIMSTTQFNVYVRMARKWISGALSYNYK
jgi:hypothetical protein